MSVQFEEPGSVWERKKKEKGTRARHIECTQHMRHASCLLHMPTTSHGTCNVSSDCDVPVCREGERERSVTHSLFF